MHNIKDLKNNLNDYRKKLLDRNFDFKTDFFVSLDEENRRLITKKEKLEQEKKLLSKSKDKSNFEKSKKSQKKYQKFLTNKLLLKIN